MKSSTLSSVVQPFPDCPALDGCHCVTGCLAKIYHHAGHRLSEEMLLGLGAGMGFIYWQMKMGKDTFVFIGGRGNVKDFYRDLGQRTGVKIRQIYTSSTKKAETALVQVLAEKQPVMLGGDMGYLPWFQLPKDYHFGGHTFVACGFDSDKTVLVSDIDQHMSGWKKGFYATVTLAELAKARSSPHKPFPPKNLRFEFDFSGFREPGKKEITASIAQTVDCHLNPPIKNFGVPGMRHTASQLVKWPAVFRGKALRMNLFNLYIFIEIGGTGGGCFRPMYARFLQQAAEIAGNPALAQAAEIFEQSGRKFTETATMFKDAEIMDDIPDKINLASQRFVEIASLEEKAYLLLRTNA